MRLTPEGIQERLSALGIEAETETHEAVFTVAESQRVRRGLAGSHCKNLFLCDRKGQKWLVVARQDAAVDLRSLASLLDCPRLSFADAGVLFSYLGVTPGAVSPLAVVNDSEGKVKVVLDSRLLSFQKLAFHPLDNTMTTIIEAGALVKFLTAEHHPPLIVDL